MKSILLLIVLLVVNFDVVAGNNKQLMIVDNRFYGNYLDPFNESGFSFDIIKAAEGSFSEPYITNVKNTVSKSRELTTFINESRDKLMKWQSYANELRNIKGEEQAMYVKTVERQCEELKKIILSTEKDRENLLDNLKDNLLQKKEFNVGAYDKNLARNKDEIKSNLEAFVNSIPGWQRAAGVTVKSMNNRVNKEVNVPVLQPQPTPLTSPTLPSIPQQ